MPALAVGFWSSTASASFPGRNGAIAYGRFGDLYVVRADGHVRQLTSTAAYDRAASFSADGRRIVFKREPKAGPARFVVAHADGTHPRTVPNTGAHDFYPSFSPDRSTLAFQSDRDFIDEIWTLGVDGTHPHRRTHSDEWNGRPSFSPDGRHIVFARTHAVYVMKRGGGELRKVAKSDAQDGPSFSPTGRRIAFANGGSLYTVRRDGTHRKRVTSGPLDFAPAYSPDGRELVFNRYRRDPTFGTVADGIYVVDTDGRHLRKLVDGVAGDRLDWQPLPR
jgi:Tol biopolymer transport system component